MFGNCLLYRSKKVFLFCAFWFVFFLVYMVSLCLSCRFYMDEHTEGSAGGGGRHRSWYDPGHVLVLLPQQ